MSRGFAVVASGRLDAFRATLPSILRTQPLERVVVADRVAGRSDDGRLWWVTPNVQVAGAERFVLPADLFRYLSPKVYLDRTAEGSAAGYNSMLEADADLSAALFREARAKNSAFLP